MFGQTFRQQQTVNHATGKIWSLEGNIYVALMVNEDGALVKQANPPFKTVTDAKSWLKAEGVGEIEVDQSGAYFEMIGTSE